MNCQSLSSVLDSHAPGELGSAQKRDVDEHLASCRTCREAWAVYAEIVAVPIPETPPGLQRRIATALDEQEPGVAFRSRRSIIVGSVLVAGATVATALTFGLTQQERMRLQPDHAR